MNFGRWLTQFFSIPLHDFSRSEDMRAGLGNREMRPIKPYGPARCGT
jgi:hypothetical protein